MPQTEPCRLGCRVKARLRGGLPDYRIVYCPVHAAAPRMREALERVANVADTARNRILREDPEEAERYRQDATICRSILNEIDGALPKKSK